MYFHLPFPWSALLIETHLQNYRRRSKRMLGIFRVPGVEIAGVFLSTEASENWVDLSSLFIAVGKRGVGRRFKCPVHSVSEQCKHIFKMNITMSRAPTRKHSPRILHNSLNSEIGALSIIHNPQDGLHHVQELTNLGITWPRASSGLDVTICIV